MGECPGVAAGGVLDCEVAAGLGKDVGDGGCEDEEDSGVEEEEGQGWEAGGEDGWDVGRFCVFVCCEHGGWTTGFRVAFLKCLGEEE